MRIETGRPNSRYSSTRVTEAHGFDPNGNGGFGVIARRNVRLDVCDHDGLRRWAVGSPMRLMKLLPALHPDVKFALNNILRLSVEGISIVAVGDDDEGTSALEAKGNARIASFFNSLPSEIGGFRGMFKQLLQELVLTGMCVVEAVPGKRGQGLQELWPVDSTTITARRKDGRIVLLQRQVYPKTNDRESYMGYVELSPETTYWQALDAQVDEPYGASLYETALAEVLSDLSIIRDLRDVIHAGAWPRMAFSFDWELHFKIATEQLNLTDFPGAMDATNWVEARYAEFRELSGKMLADDAITHPKGSDVKILTPGDALASAKQILEFLQARVMRSLLAFPAMMGIALGNTETYGSIQYKTYVLTLEELRQIVLVVMSQALTLDFQLQGWALRAEPKVEPIQTGEALTDEKVRAMRVETEREFVRLGVKTQEQFAAEFGLAVEDAGKAANFDVQSSRLTERESVDSTQGSA